MRRAGVFVPPAVYPAVPRGQARLRFCVISEHTKDEIVTALDTLLEGLEMDGAHIRVSRAMETNLPGVFAAGDCTGAPYQVAKAAGEGNIAAISAAKYLEERKKNG